MSSRISEVLLVIVLLVIAGFTRIYYGGTEAPMVVWKSEFGFKDTIVNLHDLLKRPHDELIHEHLSVVDQLEEMGIIDQSIFSESKLMPKRKILIDRRFSSNQKNTE